MTSQRGLAIVTGASSGIGAGIAKALGGWGYRVALVARRESLLREVVADIVNGGGVAAAVAGDLTKDSVREAVIGEAKARLGDVPVEILVNSAGIVRMCAIHELTPDVWDSTMDLNLRVAALLSAAVLPEMRERHFGMILNICSEAGYELYAETGAYCVSKHALRVLTSLIQEENQELGIKAWALCPGNVSTERTRGMEGNPERYLTVQDIVDVVELLVHQSSNVKMGPSILMRTTLDPNGFD
jgi:short-subunit dehydrogenase